MDLELTSINTPALIRIRATRLRDRLMIRINVVIVFGGNGHGKNNEISMLEVTRIDRQSNLNYGKFNITVGDMKFVVPTEPFDVE